MNIFIAGSRDVYSILMLQCGPFSHFDGASRLVIAQGTCNLGHLMHKAGKRTLSSRTTRGHLIARSVRAEDVSPSYFHHMTQPSAATWARSPTAPALNSQTTIRCASN